MSRTLTAATQTEMVKPSTAPRTIIKIEFGGAIGTKYYSDSTFSVGGYSIVGAVVSWGAFATALRERGSTKVSGDQSFTLKDEDQTILGYLRDVDFHAIDATVFQWFTGLAAADLTPILSGKLNQPIEFNEERGTIKFDVTDIGRWFDHWMGEVVGRDDFANIWDQHEDAVVPIVYGYVKRAPTVCVAHGAETTLATVMKYDATECAVNDGEDFPQNTAITCKVNEEFIRGSMDGNKFTITTRGYVLLSGTTSADTGNSYDLEDSGLSDANLKKYIWKLIKVDVDGGGNWQWNVITGYDTANKRWYVWFPWLTPGTSTATSVANGASYQVCGKVKTHDAGSTFRQVLDDYVWIANANESEEVISVEARGRSTGSVLMDSILYSEHSPDLSRLINPQETWVALREDEYEVDTADAATWAGHTCTTITMKNLPTDCPHGRYTSDELRVTLKGTVLQRASLYSVNPAKIIDDILLKYSGCTTADIDLTSLSAATTALAWWNFGFAFQERREVMDVVADLAFQCRSVVLFEAFSTVPKAKFVVLYNSAGSSLLTIENDRSGGNAPRRIDSLKIGSTPIDGVITRVMANWIEEAENKTHEVIDATAEATYGRRDLNYNFWAYSKKCYVNAIATWWLNRWNTVWEQVRLVTFLSTLDAERGDTVTLNIPGYYTNQPAYIKGINHSPGSGEADSPDKITYELDLPIYAGCASTCEMACEGAGCESACEIGCESACETDCESFACETGCQLPCQLVCVTGCELSCTAVCEFFCMSGEQWGCGTKCEQDCQTGCETACETSCETVCQGGCTSCCQYNCMTACQGDCTTSCESSCTTCCQYGCQTGCQIACTTACQGSCTTECQYGCQTGCEAGSCTTACQADCTTTCEGSCTTACQYGCQTSCEAGSCTSACQGDCTTTCQGACQTECEAGSCTAACQTDCTTCCQYGCQTECQGSCTASCQDGCTTACQGLCQTACQGSCTASCEGDCTTTCQGSCQTDCEGSCTESCQGSCTASCQGDCTTCCQYGCQTLCQGSCTATCQSSCTECCQWGCQTACQGDCTVTCESDCTTCCQYGCQTAATSCYYYCETDCQTGCETECETGCETGCQSECETECETGCQTACQSACTAACTTNCQQNGDVDCSMTCQIACEPTCQIWTEVPP